MALTVTVPAAAGITALANVPTYTVNGLWVTVPAAAAITALAQVPTYALTDVEIVLQEDQIFPLASARDAVNNFGGGLCAYSYYEEITLSTTGTSNPVALELPLGFLIVQVAARVTETITGAANWEVGTFLNTDQYIVNDSNLDAGYTVTNCAAFNPAGATKADGPIVGGQNEIYITTDAPATAGKIRVGVSGLFFRPFTS
jgi:hypothetical protein